MAIEAPNSKYPSLFNFYKKVYSKKGWTQRETDTRDRHLCLSVPDLAMSPRSYQEPITWALALTSFKQTHLEARQESTRKKIFEID